MRRLRDQQLIESARTMAAKLRSHGNGDQLTLAFCELLEQLADRIEEMVDAALEENLH